MISFFSGGVEWGILTCAQLTTIVLGVFGEITAQPWPPALLSVAWALFE